jgi:ATPase subunit of ABC transporter with duplicated ATPase domains
MLQYENRPLSLGGSGHSNNSQITSTNKMGNALSDVDSPSGDHMSNGTIQRPRPQQQPNTQHRHIWLITGPAGCGKSTVAEYIAQSLDLPYLEGDNVCIAYFSSQKLSLTSLNSSTLLQISKKCRKAFPLRIKIDGTGSSHCAAPRCPNYLHPHVLQE